MLDRAYANPVLHRLLLANVPRVTLDYMVGPEVAIPTGYRQPGALQTNMLLFGPPLCMFAGLLLGSVPLGGALGLLLAAQLLRLNTGWYLHERARMWQRLAHAAGWPRRTASLRLEHGHALAKVARTEGWLAFSVYTGLPLGLLMQGVVLAAQMIGTRAALHFSALFIPFALAVFFGDLVAMGINATKATRLFNQYKSGGL